MHPIATRTLIEPCRPDLVAYCPTMDLVATVTKKGGHVDVWRLNGQRVFGATFETEDDGDDVGLRNSEDREADEAEGFVRAVTWRRDGEFYFHFRFLFYFASLLGGHPQHRSAFLSLSPRSWVVLQRKVRTSMLRLTGPKKRDPEMSSCEMLLGGKNDLRSYRFRECTCVSALRATRLRRVERYSTMQEKVPHTRHAQSSRHNG